jgi:hypothetical protein
MANWPQNVLIHTINGVWSGSYQRHTPATPKHLDGPALQMDTDRIAKQADMMGTHDHEDQLSRKNIKPPSL